MNGYDTMKYTTVQITAIDQEGNTGSGSGFYMSFDKNGARIPILVTVRHVAEKASEYTLTLHYQVEGTGHISAATLPCHPKWVMRENCEVCYCLVEPLSQELKRLVGYRSYYRSIPEEDILDQKALAEIEVLQPVVMLGYPLGIATQPNGYPLVRGGWTANRPKENINAQGYLDIAAVGGSSGSPVLTSKGLKLLGVMNQTILEGLGTNTHLGVYIEAQEIRRLTEDLGKKK